MVDFNTDYWHPMQEKPTEQISLGTKDIGISMGIGDPWTSIKTAVTAGASHIELGFMGMQKGTVSSPTGVTPEIIGKAKREDIRQFAKINKVTLSTHASANVIGFAGLREDRFDDSVAQQAVYEVKRAIDFAGDTTEGGPVVVHAGEFPRPICEAGKEFLAHKDEQKKAMWGLVDKNGKIRTMLTRDYTVPRVKMKEENGVQVPEVDDKGEYIVEELSYEKFQEQAKEQNIAPEKLFFKEFMEKERLRASAERKRWENQGAEIKKQYDVIRRMEESVQALAKKDPEAARLTAKEYARQKGLVPSMESEEEYREFDKNPLKFIEKAMEHYKKEISYSYENSVAAARQEREIELEIGNKEKGIPGTIKTLREYAEERSANNIAELGMYAIEVEKKKNLKNPLFIAPENVFPEQFGSHPQELKDLILKSRKAMEDKLVEQKGMAREKAKQVAEDHIKATFDIGHANTWRKYFKEPDPDGKKFKKWFLDQTKDLMKNKIIGHVHIADNFGYYDEHLAPGQGNVPIEEFVKEVTKMGLKDKMVIEPGAQGEGESVYGTMFSAWAKVASSPIYRVGNIAKSWTDIDSSYFGATHTPRYMTGGYLVNPKSEEDNWWSGTPIE